jgi:transposase-like protein
MADIATIVGGIVGGVVTGGGGVAIIKAIASRRVTKVDAADRLSDGVLKWVEQFQEDTKQAQAEAKEARKEAAAARVEASEALAQMRTIRSEAEWLATQLKELHKAILAPGMTLERLRAMVGPGDGPNGTA